MQRERGVRPNDQRKFALLASQQLPVRLLSFSYSLTSFPSKIGSYSVQTSYYRVHMDSSAVQIGYYRVQIGCYNVQIHLCSGQIPWLPGADSVVQWTDSVPQAGKVPLSTRRTLATAPVRKKRSMTRGPEIDADQISDHPPHPRHPRSLVLEGNPTRS